MMLNTLSFPYTESITYPQTVSKQGYYPNMDKRPVSLILADNLNRLLETKVRASSGADLAKRAKIGLGTISRLRNAEASATVETIESLAKVFRLNSADLLRDDLFNEDGQLTEMSVSHIEPLANDWTEDVIIFATLATNAIRSGKLSNSYIKSQQEIIGQLIGKNASSEPKATVTSYDIATSNLLQIANADNQQAESDQVYLENAPTLARSITEQERKKKA